MSAESDKRSEEFLKISGQFKLGALVTESTHPVTAKLSDVAKRDITGALDLLFQVDSDVAVKYREFAESGRAGEIKETLVRLLRNGGRMFFTGCGSTGRLSIQLVSIWRDFWQRLRVVRGPVGREPGSDQRHARRRRHDVLACLRRGDGAGLHALNPGAARSIMRAHEGSPHRRSRVLGLAHAGSVARPDGP